MQESFPTEVTDITKSHLKVSKKMNMTMYLSCHLKIQVNSEWTIENTQIQTKLNNNFTNIAFPA